LVLTFSFFHLFNLSLYMLLALDIGNSRIKIGVFDGNSLHSKLALPTGIIGSEPETTAALETISGLDIDAAVACSVVPSLDRAVATFLKDKFQVGPYFVRNTDDFGLDIRYEPIEAAGTDRLVNCFAAAELYSVPCIVCSFGTATTIDVIDGQRVLRGGLIAPGMRTSIKALELAAERLPDVEIELPRSLVGNTTATSIQSGIYYAQIGLIETAVSRIRAEVGSDAKVIATGGFASLFAFENGLIDIWDEDLTLTGLRLLNDRRRSQPA